MDPESDNWEVLDGDLAGPHSIDTDGELYVVDDTGSHQVRVYKEDRVVVPNQVSDNR